MEKLYILDSLFSHAKTSSWYNTSELFEWDRNIEDSSDNIVITNLFHVDNFKDKKIFGWIIEPPNIDRNQYNFAIKNYHKFEKIFTYDVELLRISDKFEFVPIGGCWLKKEDRKIYEKNKLVCSIVSHKKGNNLYNLRHEILQKFPSIDRFGSAYSPFNSKIEILKNYMFCVVVENQKMDFLFTEKIIDCFLSGTVPIYLGCPSISKFFDSNGILEFDNLDSLGKILEKLDEKLYLSMMDSIIKNFEESKKFTLADDFLFKIINHGWKFSI